MNNSAHYRDFYATLFYFSRYTFMYLVQTTVRIIVYCIATSRLHSRHKSRRLKLWGHFIKGRVAD